jgi:hypothetical protein
VRLRARGAEVERHNNERPEETMTTRRTVIMSGALGAATLVTTMMPWKKLLAQP